jgi:hypothetical protein
MITYNSDWSFNMKVAKDAEGKRLLENCAASSALEKYQVSGFQVSGLGVMNRKSGA